MQVLAHNMTAMFTQRQLKTNSKEKSKSSEKLSSGYRINHASDDAAGLSISEKTRRLIRGLDQGAENIMDGISLCQVADGALDEVTSVLQRVRELSIQAYNGTNSRSDRDTIQMEVESCLGEIDEIKERTKFNEIYVLKGKQTQGEYATERVVTESRTFPVTETIEEARTLPNWIVINDKPDRSDLTISNHSSLGYAFSTELDEKMNGYMFQTFGHAVRDENGQIEHDLLGNVKVLEAKQDPNPVRIYFGDDKGEWIQDKFGMKYQYIEDFVKKKDEYPELYEEMMTAYDRLKAYVENPNHFDGTGEYGGWTPTSDDNISVKFDFALEENTSDMESLYTNMFDLLGCEIRVSCGTCELKQAIRFGGEADGYLAKEFSDKGARYVSKGNLSLPIMSSPKLLIFQCFLV